MERVTAVIAIFADHQSVDEAIAKLAEAGFGAENLRVIGSSWHTPERTIRFKTLADRITFWRRRGTLWDGLRGLLFGGLFVTVPAVEPVIVPGLSGRCDRFPRRGRPGGWWAVRALGAALHDMGVPKADVVQYGADLKTDNVLVMAHGGAKKVARAKTILRSTNPFRLDLHTDMKALRPTDHLVHVDRRMLASDGY